VSQAEGRVARRGFRAPARPGNYFQRRAEPRFDRPHGQELHWRQANAAGWSKAAAHLRAQVLFYIAENLSIRAREFKQRLGELTGASQAAAGREVTATIERLFSYAACADKFEGAVHRPPVRQLALSVHEPLGIIGVVCPDPLPLLSFVS